MAMRIVFNGHPVFVIGYYWNEHGQVEGHLMATSLFAPVNQPSYRSKPNSSCEPRRQRPDLKVVDNTKL